MMNKTEGKQLTRKEKIKELDRVFEILKKEFVGLDNILENIKVSISPWYITPEILERPVVVSLWGMTGTGKTSVVKRLTELLDLSPSTFFFDCGDEQETKTHSYDISDKIKDVLGGAGESSGNHMFLKSKDLVLVFDEFQHARSLDDFGREVTKASLVHIWSLLDSGKLMTLGCKYREAYIKEFLGDFKEFASIHPNMEVKKGSITASNDVKKILESIGSQYSDRYYGVFETKEPSSDALKPLPIMEISRIRYFVKTLNSKNPNKEGEAFKVDYLNATTVAEISQILSRVEKYLFAPTEIDCSDSLIFILGNLDEAFGVEKELNPDYDADILNDITEKVSIFDIKESLNKRFRAEQIARFGNNIIKYPTLRKEHFEEIIKREVSRVINKYQEIEGINITLKDEIYTLLYKEGVYPVQGVRPALSTVGTIIMPLLSKLTTNIPDGCKNVELGLLREEDLSVKELKIPDTDIYIEYEDGSRVIANIKLVLGELRNPENKKEKYAMAVHEAGHAVVSLYRTGIYPNTIVSVSTNNGGFVDTHSSESIKEIKTKNKIDTQVMVSMAGYLAESLIFPDESKRLMGSSSDIGQAWSIMSSAVFECGYFSQEVYSFANHTTMSANVPKPYGFDSSELERKMRSVMDKLSEDTLRILESEEKLICQISMVLGEKGSISLEEFTKLVDTYGNHLNKNFIDRVRYDNSSDYYLRELAKKIALD